MPRRLGRSKRPRQTLDKASALRGWGGGREEEGGVTVFDFRFLMSLSLSLSLSLSPLPSTDSSDLKKD